MAPTYPVAHFDRNHSEVNVGRGDQLEFSGYRPNYMRFMFEKPGFDHLITYVDLNLMLPDY